MSAHLESQDIKKTFEIERVVKAIMLGIAILVTGVLVYLALKWTAGFFESKHFPAKTWTVAIVLWFFIAHIRYYMVSVPEITGLVTIDLLPWTREENKLRAYPIGLHLRWPWEQVKEGNYINLRTMITDEVEEDFPTQAGPAMHASWSAQYEPQWYTLPIYISIDEETINQGLIKVSGETLKEEIWKIPKEKIEEARGEKEDLSKAILESYTSAAKKPVKVVLPNGTSKDISREEYYGIKITLAPISDYDFEQSYQRARTARQRVTSLKEAAKEVQKEGDKTITDKDAMDIALILDGQKVERKITEEVKRYDVTPAAAKALENAATAFGEGLGGRRSS